MTRVVFPALRTTVDPTAGPSTVTSPTTSRDFHIVPAHLQPYVSADARDSSVARLDLGENVGSRIVDFDIAIVGARVNESADSRHVDVAMGGMEDQARGLRNLYIEVSGDRATKIGLVYRVDAVGVALLLDDNRDVFHASIRGGFVLSVRGFVYADAQIVRVAPVDE